MPWNPDLYLEALHFAARAHAGQTVPGSGHPYVVHLVSVAQEVMRALTIEGAEHPDLAVRCALLHDVVEDTATPLADIETAFGPEVAQGVAALTKSAALAKTEAMRDSLTRIRARPREVWMVKLADRITNLQPPPGHWSSSKALAYRDEARVILDELGSASAALAARLSAKIQSYPLPIR